MENEDEPTIVPVKIEDEMRSSYMDYAMSVIIGRALPDVRDGLKPVHRRILYAMYEQSNTYNRAYKKSARIVGDVIGKYHPHGDSAVYDALVRMAQDFSMRVPLVDGQGNFGSVDGDPAAAMRYTEVRMTRVTGTLLADIEKETVDFGPNYDESESEPLVMPTRLPNLLINGSEGIAVGMATRIPPHNLREIVSATIHLVEHPDATLDDLMGFVPGPDFPTYGFLYGTDGIRKAYETGRGSIRIRSRAHIEENEKNGKASIIVTELPYQVNKARLLEKIAELVRDKSIDGITDLRDESDRTGMRMVIELRRDVHSEVLLNQLYKKTQLEVSFGMNMLAIVANQPCVLGLKEILNHFIDFRRDVITRRCLYELRKAEERLHILSALRKALDMIDAVIKTIRGSKDGTEAREGLITLLEIDAIQAQAILDMRLQRLTGLEINKLLEEIGEIEGIISRLREILSSETELLGVIRAELTEILDTHGDARRTEILPISGDMTMEDLIANEDEVVTLTHQGYIKRTPIREYRVQRRGGKGLKGMGTKDEDFVADVWVTTTHSSLLIFTSAGKAYRLKVYELPSGSRTTRGKPIVNMIPVDVEANEKVAAVLPFDEFDEGTFVVTGTRQGLIKKTELYAYKNVHAGGINGVSLRDGDELISARLCTTGDHIILATADGQSIRFDHNVVRATGRNTQGVIGVRLREDDEMVAMVVVSAEDIDDSEARAEDDTAAEKDTTLKTMLTVTANGYGKRTLIREYPVQNRGGLGVITIKTSDRNGKIASCRLVNSDDELIIITDGGKIIRTRVFDVSVLGRNTQGVRMISLDGGEQVVGVARFAERDDDEAEGDEGAEGAEGSEGGAVEAATDSTDSAEGTDGDVEPINAGDGE